MLLIPITVGIFLVGASSVELLYGRGEFDASSTIGTTICLWAYGIGLIPMGLILILSPAFYARENFKTPVAASVAAMMLNVILNTILVVGGGLGAASVALATSLSAWLNMLWLGYSLKKEVGNYTSPDFNSEIFKTIISTIAGSVTLIALDWMIWGGFTPWSIGLDHVYQMHATPLAVLIHLLSQCIAFTAAFGLMHWFQTKKGISSH